MSSVLLDSKNSGRNLKKSEQIPNCDLS